jgi:hypothetical protein
MQEQPHVLRELILAWRQTVDFTYSNGEETARAMSKKWPQLVTPEVAESAVKSLQKVKYWSPATSTSRDWLLARRHEGTRRVGRRCGSEAMINESFLPA